MVLVISGWARADSGGPYQGVPDPREEEGLSVFRIPVSKEPLRYYLDHVPRVRLDSKFKEPASYTWERIGGSHASFRVLGHVRGRLLYEVRYVSEERIRQGLDYADTLLILAKGFDTSDEPHLLEPVYFLSGGNGFDRRAEYLCEGHKYGAVRVTEWGSGTGPGAWLRVHLRGTEDFQYERFVPDAPEGEEGGGGPAPAAEESTAESPGRPQ